MGSCDRECLGPRLGSASVSPSHLHVSTTQVCPCPLPPPVIFHHQQDRHQSPHQKARLGPSPDPCPDGHRNAPPPPHSNSRRGDTVLLVNAGVPTGSGLSIKGGFTMQHAHVARGVRGRRGWEGREKGEGGVGGQSSIAQWHHMEARWRRPSMRSFNGGVGRGRWAGGRCAIKVPNTQPSQAQTERRRQAATEGRMAFLVPNTRLTTNLSPVPGLLPNRAQGCRGCRLQLASRPLVLLIPRQSQSSSRPGVVFRRRWRPPSVRRSRRSPEAPSPFRHGGSLALEETGRTEVALRRRSAAQTTLWCPTLTV